MTTAIFECCTCVLAGAFLSWVIQELRHGRALRSQQARMKEAIDSVVAGAAERLHDDQEAQDKMMQAAHDLAAREREAWDREREAMSAVNSQYYAVIEELQGKLMHLYNGHEAKATPDRVPAEPKEELRRKVNLLVDEVEGFEAQVLRLMDVGGLTQPQAEGYLRGELEIEDLPDFDQRLDNVVAGLIKEQVGIT